MLDIAQVNGAIGSLRAAIDIAKLIRGSTATLDQAQMNMKLADLTDQLADAVVKMSDLKIQLAELQERTREAERTAIEQQQMKFDRPFYWRTANGSIDGPFCQCCWDSNRKAIHLQLPDKFAPNCPVCRTYYPTGELEDDSLYKLTIL